MASEKLLIDLQNIDMNEVDTSDCTDVEDILSAVVTYLSELPTVDAVEVVHGLWDCHASMVRTPFALNYDCSICGEKSSKTTNYCPNCGAKMEGERNV